jgi:branched-chain amino acid transport system ATP-binding protein
VKNVLEVKNLVAGYTEEVNILNDVSIKVDDSQVVCIIGPNGSGKSTLLKTIFGFLEPKQGDILFKGSSIKSIKPYKMIKKGLCYVPQERSIFPQLTIRENLVLGAWSVVKEKDKVQGSIDRICKLFPNLEKKMGHKTAMLSGGEARMVEIARGMMIEPSLILIDEPTTGLAPKLVGEVYDKIEELKKEKVSILLVEQNIDEGISVSDYVYALELGHVSSEGPAKEFKAIVKDLVRKWLIT